MQFKRLWKDQFTPLQYLIRRHNDYKNWDAQANDWKLLVHLQLTHSFYNLRSSSDAVQAALKEGQNQLSVLTRQSAISRLYPSAQSVMETPTAIE